MWGEKSGPDHNGFSGENFEKELAELEVTSPREPLAWMKVPSLAVLKNGLKDLV